MREGYISGTIVTNQGTFVHKLRRRKVGMKCWCQKYNSILINNNKVHIVSLLGSLQL